MRVLFLTHRLPYAPNRGDRVRAFHLLREMRHWADVDLVSLVHDPEEASHVRDLDSLASSVRVARVWKPVNAVRGAFGLLSSRPLTHTLLHSGALRRSVQAAVRGSRPDVILAFCTGIAPITLEPPLDGLPLVVDMVDVDSAKWEALAEASSGLRAWVYRREARTLAHFERDIADHATATILTTDVERQLLRRVAPEARIEVIENGVDAEALRPSAKPSADEVVVFCGVMNYTPNVHGVVWMVREVWPMVRQAHPHARLQIVGSNPTSTVESLADPQTGVEVTGRVPDVRPYLWGAALSVAPLHTARGVQNKVLEAAAAGLPVVVTPAVLKGLPPEVHAACASAETAVEFANLVVRWLAEAPDARRARAASAKIQSLSWERRLAPLRWILERAAGG